MYSRQSNTGKSGADEPSAWFETAFEAGYLDVYAHRDQASAEREVAGLLSRGFAPKGTRLLDLCCGAGRHALAFRRAGRDVTGLDLSADLIARARELEDGALANRLVRGDVRALPFGPATFGSVAMLFSSWGYFEDGANAEVLKAIAGLLKSEGTLVLDLMHAARIRRTLVPESREKKDGRVLLQRRRFSPDGLRVIKEVEVTEADGSIRRWHEDVRLFEPSELESLLHASGFESMRLEGDFDGRDFDRDSPRMLVWARRTMDKDSRSKELG